MTRVLSKLYVHIHIPFRIYRFFADAVLIWFRQCLTSSENCPPLTCDTFSMVVYTSLDWGLIFLSQKLLLHIAFISFKNAFKWIYMFKLVAVLMSFPKPFFHSLSLYRTYVASYSVSHF